MKHKRHRTDPTLSRQSAVVNAPYRVHSELCQDQGVQRRQGGHLEQQPPEGHGSGGHRDHEGRCQEKIDGPCGQKEEEEEKRGARNWGGREGEGGRGGGGGEGERGQGDQRQCRGEEAEQQQNCPRCLDDNHTA